MLSDSPTKPVEDGQFEAHNRFIDIHYLVRGSELIGAALPADMKTTTPYSAENDAELFARPAHYRKIILKPGEFAVFLTRQGHMPGRSPNAAGGEIRKVVVKVLAA
jgi:YhcH/YjgK/YiaL family protein